MVTITTYPHGLVLVSCRNGFECNFGKALALYSLSLYL